MVDWIKKAYNDTQPNPNLTVVMLMSDGYFVCSIGDASPETIKKYIDEQG